MSEPDWLKHRLGRVVTEECEELRAENKRLRTDIEKWKAHQERTKALKKKAEAEIERLRAAMDSMSERDSQRIAENKRLRAEVNRLVERHRALVSEIANLPNGLSHATCKWLGIF